MQAKLIECVVCSHENIPGKALDNVIGREFFEGTAGLLVTAGARP
jgi:hypothetical protein